jgi:high-affinity nickel-transport protein
MPLDVIATQPRAAVWRRIGALYPVLATANGLAWAWAYGVLSDRPALLSTALLAYVFGRRHASIPIT